MSDPERQERLRQLEKRIEQAKATQRPAPSEPGMEDHYTQAGQAWRMVIELVAGLLIGLGIGYGLDALFGTMPLFLVLFILLGFAGGVRAMMRTAAELQNDKDAGPPADEGD